MCYDVYFSLTVLCYFVYLYFVFIVRILLAKKTVFFSKLRIEHEGARYRSIYLYESDKQMHTFKILNLGKSRRE